ncbi:MAG TPA: hypothetical protein VG841_12470 [Caulobacterales bacterium]|nr:hypothetical protein [Caulobacterales bacterium]
MKTILMALAVAVSAAAPAVASDFATGETACASVAPILEIVDRPYANPHHRDPAEVIELALNRRLYHITSRAPGTIEAFYSARNVRADITITYTDTTYSIRYKSSENLQYGQGRINAHYNRWVNNLDHDLQEEFAIPAPTGSPPPG